jgi:ATP-dependent DNA helicase RecG
MALDLSQLDEHSESETLELKEAFDNKTLETIGAFANTNGGTILVGVRDDGHITGITIGKNTLEEWAQKMQSKIQPRFLPSITKQLYKGHTVAIIVISRSVSPISVDGRHFKRVGRTNQLMSSEEHRQKLLAAGSTSWDGAVEESSTIADLDNQAILALITRLKKARRRTIPTTGAPMMVLEKLHLLQEQKPTRAAILLLGKDPKRFYPSAYIKAGRFKSPTMIIDDKEFDGNILQQVDKAMEWFQDRLETRLIIGKSKPSDGHKLSGRALVERQEVWQYPLEALREGIVNAVCHRTYTSLAATTIRLYDDRLEIWNPGRLPIQLSPEDLLHEHNSYPPNRLIAETFYNLGIIERWGSGTVRMADLLKEQDLPPPEFDVSSSLDTFKVIMYGGKREREKPDVELNDRQLKAIEYLKSNSSLSAAEYQKLFNTSKATATRDLAELARKELIVQTGRGKGISYRLIEL